MPLKSSLIHALRACALAAVLAVPALSLAEDERCADFRLPDEAPAWVHDLIGNPTFQRFLGPVQIHADEDVYSRLLDHLPLSSDLARELHLGDYVISEIDGQCTVEDGHGAKACLQELYRAPGHRIYGGSGVFELPVLPDVSGSGVVEVIYGVEDGVLVSRARLSFKIDSRVYATLTRMAVDVLQDEVDRRLLTFVQCANTLSELIADDALAMSLEIRNRRVSRDYRRVFREEIRLAMAVHQAQETARED